MDYGRTPNCTSVSPTGRRPLLATRDENRDASGTGYPRCELIENGRGTRDPSRNTARSLPNTLRPFRDTIMKISPLPNRSRRILPRIRRISDSSLTKNLWN